MRLLPWLLLLWIVSGSVSGQVAPVISLSPAGPLTFGPFVQGDLAPPGSQTVTATLTGGGASGGLAASVAGSSFAPGSCRAGLRLVRRVGCR